MDALTFHWWYVPLGLVLLFLIFGKSRGGVVKRGLTANLEVIDERFRDCRTEAKYNSFKPGTPDHIEIEIDDPPLLPGASLTFNIGGNLLAEVVVKRNREAEFDHWSDGDVSFPTVRTGDELTIYLGETLIMRGVFRQTTG